MSVRRVLHVALSLLLCALGCSLLIDPREGTPLCSVAEPGERDACPEGLECRAGRCERACPEDALEVCGDNRDNDCDGNIDEVDLLGRDTCGDGRNNDCDTMIDEGSDADGDGFTWCGNTAGGSDDAGRGAIDCDDSMKSVFPGALEVCDGRDNDCDNRIDETNAGAALCDPGSFCNQRCVAPSCVNEGPGMTICGPDERCVAETGQCVSKQCADVACAPDEYCDESSKTCRTRQKLGDGAPCSADADCASSSCIDAAALRLASGARICGRACCSNAQCPDGERCFASGTGARSCLPVGRLPNVAQRECTTDEACGGAELCALSRDQELSPPAFVAREDIITSTCQPDQPLLLQTGERCDIYAACASRACVPGLFGNLCSNPCGSSNDCMALSLAARTIGSSGAYCRYVDVTLDDAPPDYAAVCVMRRFGETGDGVYGAPCTTGRDCLEAGCVNATASSPGRCTPTCCDDSQCGPREDGQPISCRPFAFGDRYEMRCDL